MSNYNRKYQKVTGSWTYGHIVVPEKLIYIGSSDQPECNRRWNPSGYRGTELYPYIKKYGWGNIKHIVFKDGLTPKQAEQLEDLLIKQAKIDGWCINKQGSGGESRDNPKEYKKQYDVEHKDENRKYYKDNREKLLEQKKQYYKTHKEIWLTPEKIIYRRVANYNRRHQSIETPLEAKNKYLEYGYIPSYIKNDDLV